MKKLSHILEVAYGRPLLIRPSTFHVIHDLLMKRIASGYHLDTVAEIFDDLSSEEETPMMVVDGNIATLNINGIIGNHLSLFEKSCLGGVDIRDIKASLDLAVEDENVETIVLSINSPGGSADSVDAVANHIYDIAQNKKQIIAWTPDVMASAALYMGVGASEVYAHPYASTIGSVGVYSAFLDSSVAFANEGLKWEIFSAGKYKTEGMSGTSLSDEYKELMTKSVADIYEQFTGFVMKCRKKVTMESMQGLTYNAQEAMELGFIDGIAENISDIFVSSLND